MYATSGLLDSSKRAKTDIGDILQSGQYYCNEEIARELTDINNGLEHIKLDKDLRKSDRGGLGSGAVNNLSDYLKDYKSQMGVRGVLNKQENEVRTLNQLALTNLRGMQENLLPEAVSASDRIRQFADEVGVTDRFTSYRNNLTRTAREPDPTMWADRPGFTRAHTTIGSPASVRTNLFGEQMAPDYGVMGRKITFGTHASTPWALKGYRTVDSLYPKRINRSMHGDLRQNAIMTDIRTMNALNASSAPSSASGARWNKSTTNYTAYTITRPPSTMSPQERAGIVTKFPGRTEYQARYLRPPTDIPASSFTINPKPNFAVDGRPLATARIEPRTTEFASRYLWPDGNLIAKDPWLRK